MLGLLVLGCQREEPVSGSAQGIVSTAAAREWYDKHLASASGRENKQLPERTPLWDSAQAIMLDNGLPAVAVPLRYRQRSLGTGGLARLLLYEQQGRWQARIMKMVSDSAYFYANGETIDLENFTGILTLYDWQENFVGGVGFANGKTTGSLSKPNASARTGDGCQLVTITHYTRACVGDYCTTSIDYEESYIECSGGGGGGNPLPTGPVVGGGGGSPGSGQPGPFTFLKPRISYTIPGQDKQPIDLAKYLDCFGASLAGDSYQITVYVDEPIAGSGETKNGLNVGHTFVGFKKTSANGGSIEQVFGFYPGEYSTGWVKSKFASNGGSPYTVSVSFPVTGQQFLEASNAARYTISQMYNVQDQNCTDVVFYIFDAMGIGLPKNKSPFLFGVGGGHSPGQLGLDFRNQASAYSVNTTAGNAPASKGPC
jgi:hypothetical protein